VFGSSDTPYLPRNSPVGGVLCFIREDAITDVRTRYNSCPAEDEIMESITHFYLSSFCYNYPTTAILRYNRKG
jgi:hypothetical protein